MLYKLIIFGLWRTVESNHANPALLITNPGYTCVPAVRRLPRSSRVPCRWRTSEWACGAMKKEIKRLSS